MEMEEDMDTDSGEESVEDKLRRLLHTGSTSAHLKLQNGFKRSGFCLL